MLSCRYLFVTHDLWMTVLTLVPMDTIIVIIIPYVLSREITHNRVKLIMCREHVHLFSIACGSEGPNDWVVREIWQTRTCSWTSCEIKQRWMANSSSAGFSNNVRHVIIPEVSSCRCTDLEPFASLRFTVRIRKGKAWKLENAKIYRAGESWWSQLSPTNESKI